MGKRTEKTKKKETHTVRISNDDEDDSDLESSVALRKESRGTRSGGKVKLPKEACVTSRSKKRQATTSAAGSGSTAVW